MLKGLVLLPNNEIRLEFDNEISKSIIEMAELFHDGKLLIACDKNPLEENYTIETLPKIGVVSKISKKIELPNNKIRVIIKGLYRASIKEYLNLNRSNEILESIISKIDDEEISKDEEDVFVRKLFKELESVIKEVPYMSNSVLNLISFTSNLSVITDLIVSHLPINNERLLEYLYEVKSTERMKMIINDLWREKELFSIEKKLDLKVKEEIDNHQKEYLLREKIKMMREELGDITSLDSEIDELRMKIDNLNVDSKIKDRLKKELRKYENTNSSSPEASIIKNYIEYLLELPWNIYTKDNENLKDVKNYLDKTHYGMEKIKTRIIEYLAVKQMTKSLNGPILCLVGPPGVGKTSLAYSIAKAINRHFVKISLGGISDEAEIKGHRRAYIGSSPGRIIASLKKSKSNNPVFLIDEIDKMTKDVKGDPASALLDILDPEQNKYFSDNYIEEEYDLSNVMFIATANYIEDIPFPLRDRLEVIELSGYTEYEKLDIAKKHLIPKICINHGISENKIIINDEGILEIIRYYTKESGVRELERLLSQIIRKIVTSVVLDDISLDKMKINKKDIIKYLGNEKYRFVSSAKNDVGVVNGLAYTYFGGDTLPIEVNYYKGNGNLVLTGSLGEVMKESAHIALSYLKSNYKYYDLDYNKIVDNDIHIHVPEGAIPKDGPSAGIALTTALISSLKQVKIKNDIAMTGEITLRGNVLAIGGLKEKSIGAHRKGIKNIIIPYDNLKDLEEIPNEIKSDINYIPVKNYKEVIKYVLGVEK